VLSEQGKWVEYGNEPADYEIDVLARKAIAFIEESTASGEPFFLYLAPIPHTIRRSPRRGTRARSRMPGLLARPLSMRKMSPTNPGESGSHRR